MSARITSLVLVLVFGVFTLQARAVDLPPGGSVSVSGVAAPGGLVIADRFTPFEIFNATGALLYKGELQDRVIKEGPGGTLSFGFLIRNTQPGLNGILTAVQRSSFAGYTTDVDFSTTSLGTIGPDTVKRTSDGKLLDFQFNTTPVYSGAESRRTYAITDAPWYADNGQVKILLNEGSSVTVPAYAPAVPEPATLALLALGALGLLARRRSA